MHKIFITGGCGFIGSHLTEYFLINTKILLFMFMIRLIMQQMLKT